MVRHRQAHAMFVQLLYDELMRPYRHARAGTRGAATSAGMRAEATPGNLGGRKQHAVATLLGSLHLIGKE